jgi:hypothetical protein
MPLCEDQSIARSIRRLISAEHLLLSFPVLLTTKPHDKAGFDRQFRSGEFKCPPRNYGFHAIKLKHYATRFYPTHPEFGRPLAFTHTHFGWLLTNRHVGEYSNPYPTRALNVTRDCPPRRFDLARRDAPRRCRFQTITAEIEGGPSLRQAFQAAFLLLAVFSPLWAKHRSVSWDKS